MAFAVYWKWCALRQEVFDQKGLCGLCSKVVSVEITNSERLFPLTLPSPHGVGFRAGRLLKFHCRGNFSILDAKLD